MLHKQSTAKCGALLPRGTCQLSAPPPRGCRSAQHLARDGEREDGAVRGPEDHRSVHLPGPWPAAWSVWAAQHTDMLQREECGRCRETRPHC